MSAKDGRPARARLREAAEALKYEKPRLNAHLSSEGIADPTSLPDRTLSLQRSAGNRAVERLLEGRQASAGNQDRPASPVQRLATREGADLLEPSLRSKMERQFATDFSDVRVHTGAEAHHRTAARHAAAITRHRDIYLHRRVGTLDREGRSRVLAHELAHVCQQSPGPGEARHKPAAELEREARAAGSDMGRVSPVTFGTAPPGVPQGMDLEELEKERAAREETQRYVERLRSEAAQAKQEAKEAEEHVEGIRKRIAGRSKAQDEEYVRKLRARQNLPEPPREEDWRDIPESPAPALEKGQRYVDAFEDVAYNPHYRAAPGRFSTWLQVVYDDPAIPQVDVDINSIVDAAIPTGAQPTAPLGKTHLEGRGRVVFPETLSRGTAPRLWQMKQHVRKYQDDINAGFTIDVFLITWSMMPTGPIAMRGTGGSVRRPLSVPAREGPVPGGRSATAPPARGKSTATAIPVQGETTGTRPPVSGASTSTRGITAVKPPPPPPPPAPVKVAPAPKSAVNVPPVSSKPAIPASAAIAKPAAEALPAPAAPAPAAKGTLDERIAAVEAALDPKRADVRESQAARVAGGGSKKGGSIKGLWNLFEERWVLKRQRAYPDRQLLKQAELVGVKQPDGTIIPTKTIAKQGREFDFVEFTGSKATGGDLKSESELKLSIKGGVSKPKEMEIEFRPKSKIGGQHEVEQKVLNAARKSGGKLLIRGEDVRTGETVEKVVDVKDYESTVATYSDVYPN